MMMHVKILAKFATLKSFKYLLSFVIIYNENERSETFNPSIIGNIGIIIILLFLLNKC